MLAGRDKHNVLNYPPPYSHPVRRRQVLRSLNPALPHCIYRRPARSREGREEADDLLGCNFTNSTLKMEWVYCFTLHVALSMLCVINISVQGNMIEAACPQEADVCEFYLELDEVTAMADTGEDYKDELKPIVYRNGQFKKLAKASNGCREEDLDGSGE